MKKILTTIVTCLLATASLLAQGRIAFANSSATPVRITSSVWLGQTFYPGITNVLGTASTAFFGVGPASVRIQLLAGLTPSSLLPVLVGTAANQLYVTNTASGIAAAQGTFSGGNPLPLPGFDGSVPVFLQMVALSINGLWYGDSPIIQVMPALAPATATPVFSTTADGSHWDGLLIGYPELYPSPEPSSLALLGMSFSLMFLARRRR